MNLTLVAGHGTWAAEVALKHVARHAEAKDTRLVIDSRGIGANVAPLHALRRMASPCARWFDLGDRRRPVALVGLGDSTLRAALVTEALGVVARLHGTPVSEAVCASLGRLAHQAAGRAGLVTLETLMRLVEAVHLPIPGTDQASPEVKLQVREALGEALAWALRFAAVRNLCVAANRARFENVLARPGLVWLEAEMSDFEPLEHILCVYLCRLAVRAALGPAARAATKRGGRLVIVDLCPEWTRGNEVKGWLDGLPTQAKVVAAVHLHARRGLTAAGRQLAMRAGRVLLCSLERTPDLDTIRETLPAWSEALGRLRPGQVAVAPPDDSPALTIRVDYGSTVEAACATTLRLRAAASRAFAKPRQASDGVPAKGHFIPPENGVFERVTSVEGLRTGWFHIRRAGAGSAGVDGVTVHAFRARLPEALARLSAELRSGVYRPQPLLRLYVPKPDGGVRAIGIPSVRDRVAQGAVLHHLEPLWEPRFSPFSFAFRPRRGAHDALTLAHEFMARSLCWTVSADIEKCFDHVDHNLLLSRIRERVEDQRLLRVIRLWAESEVLELGDVFASDIGVPQGLVLSPFLANVYLDPLDDGLARADLTFIRYADDLIIFTDSPGSARHAYSVLEGLVRDRLQMSLKPSKTRFSRLEEGVPFLGFDLLHGSRRIGRRALDRIGERIDGLLAALKRELAPGKGATEVLAELTAVIVGWRGYFGETLTPEVRSQLQALDERMVRAVVKHLPAEKCGPCRGLSLVSV